MLEGDLAGSLLAGYTANSHNATFNSDTGQLNLDGDLIFLILGTGSPATGPMPRATRFRGPRSTPSF